MSAGTLTLTNNSAAVAGSSTTFTTELAAGDFIVVTVGGVTYTLPVKSIESATALTLVSNFTGPTQSGAAWSAVPRVALNMVTAALVAQSAEALRGLNYDKQNWQSIFSSASDDVTVTLPDLSKFTGPSWLRIKKLLEESDIEAIKPIAAQVSADAKQVAADKNTATGAANTATTKATEASASASAANTAKTAAESARTTAQQAATNASGSATNAKSDADRAKAAADSIDTAVLEQKINSKADKVDGSVPINQGGTGSTTAAGARTSLGLGNSATRDVGTTTGMVCAGDDARLETINNKTGGTVNGSVLAQAGNEIGLKESANPNGIRLWNESGNIGAGFYTGYLQAKWYNGGFVFGPVRGTSTDVQYAQLYVSSNGAGNSFNFYPDGRAVGNWQPTSDIRIKSLIETIPDPLSIMGSMRGYSWYYENTQTQGFGFMADEARKFFPGAVKKTKMNVDLPDGKEVKNVESVDTYGIAAALHHEAILAMMDQIGELKAEIKKLKGE